jgi:hypothetical protein
MGDLDFMTGEEAGVWGSVAICRNLWGPRSTKILRARAQSVCQHSVKKEAEAHVTTGIPPTPDRDVLSLKSPRVPQSYERVRRYHYGETPYFVSLLRQLGTSVGPETRHGRSRDLQSHLAKVSEVTVAYPDPPSGPRRCR